MFFGFFFFCIGFGSFCILLGLKLHAQLRGHKIVLRRFDAEAAAQRHPTDVAAQARAQRPLKLIILHPDLGIGGAEKLIVDAAVGIQRHQHVTPIIATIITNHHDSKRAFVETTNGSLTVQVSGDWIPSSIFGRAKVFCVTLRMFWAAITASYLYPDVDCFMIDQVAGLLPLLYYIMPHIPRIFYCHFPDRCCDSNRDDDGSFMRSISIFHRIYRCLFDAFEYFSFSYADTILFNSKFTMGVVLRMFPHLSPLIDLENDIFYPPVSCVRRGAQDVASFSMNSDEINELQLLTEGRSLVLSINRYEKRKGMRLAIEAFTHMLSEEGKLRSKPPLLVIAGGYDPRSVDNVQCLQMLRELAARHGLTEQQVLFLKNISDEVKKFLLARCSCFVYTPQREHFGIGPVESMAFSKPVIAVNSGGPCESVAGSGTLCDPTPEAFAAAMRTYLEDEELSKNVGAVGCQRVAQLFSLDVFSERLGMRIVKLWTRKNMTFAPNQSGDLGGKVI